MNEREKLGVFDVESVAHFAGHSVVTICASQTNGFARSEHKLTHAEAEFFARRIGKRVSIIAEDV